jgi:hypothetical protein
MAMLEEEPSGIDELRRAQEDAAALKRAAFGEKEEINLRDREGLSDLVEWRR